MLATEGLSLVTAPTTEPVSATEVKMHASIESSEWDSLLTILIAAARQWAEEYTNRSFIDTAWSLALDAFPDGNVIVLPKSPLYASSVSDVDIIYTDTNGDSQQVATTAYELAGHMTPGRVYLLEGQSWPSTINQREAIGIIFHAGYGTTAASVPAPIRLAILLLVTHWFDNRSVATRSVSYEAMESIPFGIKSLLNPYRVMELF